MPQLSSVLLIDGEAQSLELLSFAFEREGAEVVLAPDPGRALDAAQRARPPVVVLNDTGGDGAASVAFCQQLRAMDALRDVPVLLLGDREARPGVVAAGGSAFLSKPAYLRDVVTMARLLAQGGAGAGTNGKPPVEAPLSEYGLYFLMRALAAVRASTVVNLTRTGRRGELHIADGVVTVARSGGVSGLPALHALLLWSDANLTVRFGGAQRARQIPLSTEETLADAERFLRDFRAAAAPLGPPDAVLGQDLGVVAQRIAHIPSQVAPVLRLFDGRRTITDVAADSPFTAFDSLRIAQRLHDLGAIRRLPIDSHATEAVRGEIIGRCTPDGTVPRPGAHGKVVVEKASLAERLEAVLASQEPIPLATPKKRPPPDQPAAWQADPFAALAAFPGGDAPPPAVPAAPPPAVSAPPPVVAAPPPVVAAPPPAVSAPPPVVAAPPPAVSAPPPAVSAPPPVVSAPPPDDSAPPAAVTALPPPAVVLVPAAVASPKPPPVAAAPASQAPAPVAASTPTPPVAASTPTPPVTAPAQAPVPLAAAPASKVPQPAAAPAPPPAAAEPSTPHFSQLEEDFFAQADRLQHVEKVDTFEDLFDAADQGKLGWFGIRRGAATGGAKGGNGKSAAPPAKTGGNGAKDGHGRGAARGHPAKRGKGKPKRR